MAKIIVKNQTIKTLSKNGVDYICITDIARQKNPIEPKDVVKNWLRSKNLKSATIIQYTIKGRFMSR